MSNNKNILFCVGCRKEVDQDEVTAKLELQGGVTLEEGHLYYDFEEHVDLGDLTGYDISMFHNKCGEEVNVMIIASDI
jgi:hypothetical protein